MNELNPGQPNTPLPVVAQPRGWRYYLGTWSGRLLLINTVVFIYICWRSGSVMMPTTETLLNLGAKDPVLLAQGQYWRLLTPIFIHIGLLHFAFNMYFLYVVGWQLERILGSGWFIAIYLLAGVAGNIASAVFSIHMSAGASSSLFGLLGAGLFLERTIGRRIMQVTGRRPRNRAYLMTVAINLGFGFLVPFIDNSAHLGGLVAGTLMTFAMVNLRPNNLQTPRRFVGVLALIMLAVGCGVGAYYGSNPALVAGRLAKAGDKAEDADERIYDYTQALALAPDDTTLRLKRARELFLADSADDTAYAFHDVRAILAKGPALDQQLQVLAAELEGKGKKDVATEIRRLLNGAI